MTNPKPPADQGDDVQDNIYDAFNAMRIKAIQFRDECERLKARNAELEAILAQPAIGFAIKDSTGWLVGIYLYNAIEGHLEIDPGSTVTELIPRVSRM